MSGRCPVCGKAYEIASLDDLPTFPFCSDRCRLLDLGRWIDGGYVIPGSDPPPAPLQDGEAEPDEA